MPGRNLGPLRCGCSELLQVVRQELYVLPAAIFQNERESAGRADAGNRRRRKTQREPVGQFRKLLIHVLHDLLILRLAAGAVLPIVERDEKESGVAGAHEAEQAEAGHARRVLHAGRVQQDLLHFRASRFRPLERRSVGKLQVHEHVALVLARQKARRYARAEERGARSGHHQQHDRDRAFADQRPGPVQISIGSAAEPAVEPIEESPQQAVAFLFRLQQQRGQRGTQRQRVERRQDHGNRDRHGELLVKPARDARDENGGHEHR